MNAGARIASLRKARGWTQAQLAKESQLSPSAIAMYETNRRFPDAQALEKLAAVFGEPVHSLRVDAETAATRVDDMAAQQVRTQTADETRFAQAETSGLTNLALTREEARVILFLRMNPNARSFLESYVTADEATRHQLERTWKLIQDFRV